MIRRNYRLSFNFPRPFDDPIAVRFLFKPAFIANKFFQFAVKEGVTFVPGSFFYPGQRTQSFLRLNFAINEPNEIQEGIRRLSVAFHKFIANES